MQRRSVSFCVQSKIDMDIEIYDSLYLDYMILYVYIYLCFLDLDLCLYCMICVYLYLCLHDNIYLYLYISIHLCTYPSIHLSRKTYIFARSLHSYYKSIFCIHPSAGLTSQSQIPLAWVESYPLIIHNSPLHPVHSAITFYQGFGRIVSDIKKKM